MPPLKSKNTARELAALPPPAPPTPFWLLSVKRHYADAIGRGDKRGEIRTRRYHIPAGGRIFFYAPGDSANDAGITATAVCAGYYRRLGRSIKAAIMAGQTGFCIAPDDPYLRDGAGYWIYGLERGEFCEPAMPLSAMRELGISPPQGARRIAPDTEAYTRLSGIFTPF